MKEKIELSKKALLEALPQIPMIIDEVAVAADWAIASFDEGKAYKVLESAREVCDYTNFISEKNYFRTFIVIAALLRDIPNVFEQEEFKRFDTASKAVRTVIKGTLLDPVKVKARGYYDYLSHHVVELGNSNPDCLFIILSNIHQDLKEMVAGMQKVGVTVPITQEDYVVAMGYSLALINLTKAHQPLVSPLLDLIHTLGVLYNSSIKY